LPSLNLVLWNMEWMNDLFVSNEEPPAFRPDDAVPAHHSGATVRERRDHLSGALDELSPDIVVIVEGEWRTGVQVTKGMSQCVGVAARVDQGKFDDPPFTQFDTNGMEAFGDFPSDVDDDGIDEVYGFERRPLYAEIKPKGGQRFRVLEGVMNL
jgi:hypothetical protein